jgi:hypothetical protein
MKPKPLASLNHFTLPVVLSDIICTFAKKIKPVTVVMPESRLNLSTTERGITGMQRDHAGRT